MISATQFNKIYDQHCQFLKAEAKRIADSSVARAWLNKNVGKTDPIECLEMALRCIYDLTGDETIRKLVERPALGQNEVTSRW